MKLRLDRMCMKSLLSMVIALPLSAQVPTVFVDTPTAGSTATGTVTVSGWALDNFANTAYASMASPIAGVVIQVDGATVGSASLGISRPDVCQVFQGGPGCPNIGWAYSLNTTTLAPGSHAITAFAADSSNPPHTGSVTVQVTVASTPSPTPGVTPVVFIESPTPGAAVSGTINVAGWALAATTGQASPIASVQVEVDGVMAGTATYGAPRQDICSTYPAAPNCPNIGYSFPLNTANYTPGSHVITVLASGPSGVASATANVTVTTPPSIYIEVPSAGASLSGTVTVAGWALDNATSIGTGISSVKIQVDGNTVGTANYGVERDDVCAVYPGRPGCPFIGFNYQLNTAGLAPGTHTLTAVATDTDPIPDSGQWTLNFTVASSTLVTIESPASGSYVSGNYVTVSGWTLDSAGSSGTPISSVQVSIDGAPAGPAYYGYFGRPDICSAYPGAAGCPNVGFFYYLNASTLSPGPHTLTVTATDSSNPPNTGSASITVNAMN